MRIPILALVASLLAAPIAAQDSMHTLWPKCPAA
jgi:hypothetical protein